MPKSVLKDLEPHKLTFSQTKMGCDHTCYGLRQWFHSVADKLLVPLHEAHTVQRVYMRTSQHDADVSWD